VHSKQKGVTLYSYHCVRAEDSLCTKSSKPRIQKHFIQSSLYITVQHHTPIRQSARYCLFWKSVAAALGRSLVS
jgi:hypothetical protein